MWLSVVGIVVDIVFERDCVQFVVVVCGWLWLDVVECVCCCLGVGLYLWCCVVLLVVFARLFGFGSVGVCLLCGGRCICLMCLYVVGGV